MTSDFKTLLMLLSSAALGMEPKDCPEIDSKNLYNLSVKHQVYTIVYPVVDELCKKGRIHIDSDIISKWESAYISSIVFATQRQFYIASLVQKFREKDIGYCILKGSIVSGLYCHPENRISGDVDIWIKDSDEFNRAVDILRLDNFSVKKSFVKSHQTECYHKKYGLIELHSDLCDSAAKEIWFDNKLDFSEPYRTYNDGVGEYSTLSVTDGAIFVAFHFIKHFLSHGSGCRQLCDMLLYLKKYEEEINWKRFDSFFSDLNYLEFIHVCKQIGNKYMSMDFKMEEEFEDSVCEAVVSDIETSGVFGNDEAYRKDFTDSFTKKRKANKAKHWRTVVGMYVERITAFLKRNKVNPFKMARVLRNRRINRNTMKNDEKIKARMELFEKLGFFN